MSSSSEDDGSENEDKASQCESRNSLHFSSKHPNPDPAVYNDPQFLLLDTSEHQTFHSTTLQQPCFFTHLPNDKPPLTKSLPLPYQHHPTTLFAPLSPQVSTSYHIGTPSDKRTTTTRHECFEIDVNSCMSNAGK